ncbi:MAG: hypothetical protein ACOZCK_05085 [Pseudomonadota bacterium]
MTAPAISSFSHTGYTGLAEAFVDCAVNSCGMENVGTAPRYCLQVANFDGHEEDRPSWFGVGGDSIIIMPWGGSDSLFNPYSLSLTESDEVAGLINGITGAWWILVNGTLRMVGSRIRRFPADMHSGIFPRYAVLSFSPIDAPRWKGVFHSGYGYSASSIVSDNASFFSPIWRPGEGSNPFGITPGTRIPDTMAPSLAPLFPVVDFNGPILPVFYMGEFMDIMAATDGFTIPSSPIPGWSVVPTKETGGPYFAVPIPL